MHIDKRKSKNNVTVSVIDTRSVVKIMSGILVIVPNVISFSAFTVIQIKKS